MQFREFMNDPGCDIEASSPTPTTRGQERVGDVSFVKFRQRIRNVLRGLLQAYGTGDIKRFLWNNEFSSGRWNCLDSTPGDCVYQYVERYANNGSILDLGCGSGSTANELDVTKYRDYTGTDISDVAIEKARKRSEGSGRAHKNRFLSHDMFSYVPNGHYDVILFRDSIYYVRRAKIRAMLYRYSKYLKEGAVLIVRMWHDTRSILPIIESDFEVVEKFVFDRPEAVVIVFRPRSRRAYCAAGTSRGITAVGKGQTAVKKDARALSSKTECRGSREACSCASV